MVSSPIYHAHGVSHLSTLRATNLIVISDTDVHSPYRRSVHVLVKWHITSHVCLCFHGYRSLITCVCMPLYHGYLIVTRDSYFTTISIPHAPYLYVLSPKNVACFYIGWSIRRTIYREYHPGNIFKISPLEWWTEIYLYWIVTICFYLIVCCWLQSWDLCHSATVPTAV